jgi:UDP-N-acetylmuramyl pentapeptide phosphotransferase/UDP-N-acetylglucosamine-1-phosphate transferase
MLKRLTFTLAIACAVLLGICEALLHWNWR